MRPFVIEEIFWSSATHAFLRAIGVSRRNVYRVMVRAEPVWLRDVESGRRTAAGLFATRVVIASSEARARDAAVALVREAVLPISGNPKETPVLFEVEEAEVVRGVVWRQPRGFTLWEEN
ncbi:hypothetical protein [Anaeromyxobacter terrae]|uniref:hypothetical protein n=1 Tax=Anaeromyxobacter terrae TaxID=2925406 RepID=UPI001F560EB5|nr:hypothetical protein [Anaeromyxobacter sp. SG22]